MAGLKILIVDDEPLVSDLIRRRLTRTEPAFDISVVESAYECLERLKENPVDCILSDFQMPGMDGMELLERLRKSGDSTPFVFITGQGNEELAREAFKRGASDYFTKEVGFAHFDRITNSVRQAVSRRLAEDERASAERMLDGERQKLEAVFAAIGDGICIVDREYRAVYFNSAYAALIGAHAGEECYKYIQGKGGVCDCCPIEQTFADGQVHHARKLVRKGGKDLYVEISSSPLTDHEGNIVASVKVVRDVTEHVEADRRLAESESMYRLMFEGSPVPMWVFDEETLAVVAVNMAAIEHYGYSEEEFLSITVKELRPPGDMPAFLDFINKNPDRAGSSGIWRHAKKDGTIISAEVTSHRLVFRGRRSRVVQARDLTQHIRMQEELARSERLNRAIVDTLPHMVFILDMSGTFVDVRSPESGNLYVPREAALGKKVEDIFPSSLAELMMENLSSVSATGEPRSFEYDLDLPGGRRRFVARVSPLGMDGRLLGIVQDVTEQNRLEKQREELFAMLRHDMKTPLAVISGNADMLMHGHSSALEPEAVRMLDTVRSGARTITRMLDDIVAISRLESLTAGVDRETVDVADMLLEVSVLASEAARAKGVTYARDFSERLGMARLNKSYVQRAASNLIDNAVKYTPPGGGITLRADISENGGHTFLEISVSDTGPGVPEDERELIFEKYYRSSKVQPNTGTGLGLAIVKAVAELHGGSVAVSSREIEGSIFTLRIPAR